MFLTFGELLKWTLWKVLFQACNFKSRRITRNFKVYILLLACVFETFRKESMNSFELDPTHYLSISGYYSCSAMLRFTDANIKLLWNIEKCQFLENTIRSGISIVCKGYAEATNKFCKSYKANKSTSYIIYLDANNLYGHSMMLLFPTKIQNWINPKDLNLDIYYNNSTICCSLEVDLVFPQ